MRFSLAMTSRQLPGTPPVAADRASLEWDGLCSPSSPGHPGKDMSLNSVNQTPDTRSYELLATMKLQVFLAIAEICRSKICMKE